MKTLLKSLIILSCTIISARISAQSWTRLSCGGEFSLGIRADGSLWAWGYNGNGQLGNSDTNVVVAPLPLRIKSDNSWKDVSAGGFHSLGIKKNGTIWSWGSGGNGQVGNGMANYVNATPAQIGSDTDWAGISAGTTTSYALKKSGILYAWGDNTYGQLGDSDTVNALAPVLVHTARRFKQVSAGGVSAAALGVDGTLWTWGYGGDGQLGNNDTLNVPVPRQVGADTDWVYLSSGLEFSIAQKRNGTIWSWGVNNSGQCGQGDTITPVAVPTQVGKSNNWKTVACGSVFAFGIQKNGSLYGWGDNYFGELGINSTTQQLAPVRVGTDSTWTFVAGPVGALLGPYLYGYHSLGIKKDYTGFCATGWNNTSQLGNNDTAQLDVFDCTMGIITGIQAAVQNQPDIAVFPNPSSGIFTVRYSNPNGLDSKIDMINQTGQAVYPGVMNNTESADFDVSGYPKGIYFIRIISGNKIYVDKLILN